jgi:hypothetical protein
MREYQCTYCNNSLGVTTVTADSASDAKAIVESRSTPSTIVFQVKGPNGTIDYMSYSEADKIWRSHH